MSKIVAGACMSLDGYIAGPEESGFEHLFAWLGNGDVEVPTAQPERTLRTTAASAEVLRAHAAAVGALVVGRRLFDLTKAWGHARGVASAIEQAITVAGEHKLVGVNGGEMTRQCPS